jgi:hypothetical protein
MNLSHHLSPCHVPYEKKTVKDDGESQQKKNRLQSEMQPVHFVVNVFLLHLDLLTIDDVDASAELFQLCN